MKQLLLDIRLDAPPTLDNFVAGSNQALVTALATTVAASDGHLYLWGEPGCGRTHLLKAACHAATLVGRPSHYRPAPGDSELPATPQAVVAVDDVHTLPETQQIDLFNAYNRTASTGQTLLLAGNAPPRDLALREDLRTRIGQTLVFQVRPLDDLARSAILHSQAERRGLRLEREVIDYLLRYGRRDLPSLLTVLDALDEASLERKRPITLPLLRQIMQAGLDI